MALQTIPMSQHNLKEFRFNSLEGDRVLSFNWFRLDSLVYRPNPLAVLQFNRNSRTIDHPDSRLKIAAFLFAIILCLVPFGSGASAASVTLQWDRNQEDVAGYRLYYGTVSRATIDYPQVIDVGDNNEHRVTGLQGGTQYFFAVTAYDNQNNESAYSKEVDHTTAVDTYTITTSAGANGRITPAGPITANEGTNRIFTIHPDAGYQILNVKIDGDSIGTETKYTFEDISADHTIEAGFTYIAPAVVPDSDGDGVPDDEDDFPNNPDETVDTDGDGTGDNGDTDDDNDGMPDDWENIHGFNTLQNDADGDPDGDGITNLNEYLGGTEPRIYEEFLKPDKPGQLSPSEDEVVSLEPVLQTGEFSDPDLNDIHAKSHWQIFRSKDRVCVFEKTSSGALTQLVVPKLLLDNSTAYEWRVRFVDNHGLSSDWSEKETFATDDNPEDRNRNGIPDDQEVAPTLDLDEDGIPDNDQSHIKCVGIAGESAQVGISIRDSEFVESIVSIEIEDPLDLPEDNTPFSKNDELPFGLIRFKLIVSQPGDEAVVTLHLSQPASQDGRWYKYDPVEGIWHDYAAYTKISTDRRCIFIALVDGGIGDADGVENGIIVDPLGFIDPYTPPRVPAAAIDEASGGGGGGGGCFISPTAVAGSTDSLSDGLFQYIWIAFVLILLFLLGVLKPCKGKLNSVRFAHNGNNGTMAFGSERIGEYWDQW
jgi:hypothetical protein